MLIMYNSGIVVMKQVNNQGMELQIEIVNFNGIKVHSGRFCSKKFTGKPW